MSKISIIVPVYNAEDTLNKCIDSVCQQEFSDYELILINDGSKDKSKDIIDMYSGIFPNIISIHKNNEGVARARNLGLDRALGEYIMFLDSDDWLEDRALSKINYCLEKYSPDIIGFNSYIERPDNQTKTGCISEFEFAQGEGVNNIINNLTNGFIWDKVFKNKIIKDNKIRFDQNYNYGEDTLFYCDYLLNITSMAIIPEHLYHYRRFDQNSLSTKYVSDMDFVLDKIVEKNNKIIDKFTSYGRALSASLYYETTCIHTIYNLYNESSPLKSNERRTKIKSFMDKELYQVVVLAVPTSLFKKFIVLLFKTKNPFIMDLCLSISKLIRGVVLRNFKRN